MSRRISPILAQKVYGSSVIGLENFYRSISQFSSIPTIGGEYLGQGLIVWEGGDLRVLQNITTITPIHPETSPMCRKSRPKSITFHSLADCFRDFAHRKEEPHLSNLHSEFSHIVCLHLLEPSNPAWRSKLCWNILFFSAPNFPLLLVDK